MNQDQSRVEADRQMLAAAQEQGTGATLWVFTKLSGPGWMQSAMTLGGGSLASSLYLGVLGGYSLLWLQPVAMILGIIMLSAIGYVTLSTGKRPLRAINEHVNPVLGYSWILATMMANIVWCLPQFSLANSVLQQNLLPDLVGVNSPLGEFQGKLVIALVILVTTLLITWSYGSGHWGIKIYEILLKAAVGVIVLCFLLVVVSMTLSGSLDWGNVLRGIIPRPWRMFEPAAGFGPYLDQVDAAYRGFWNALIVDNQRDRMVAAAATAVGINMTFLFPYSLLQKGWTKEFRGLAVFDLATGMFIPFILATGCVVIASAAQFHTKPVPGLVQEDIADDGTHAAPTAKELKDFRRTMTKRLIAELGQEKYDALASDEAAVNARIEQMPKADRMLAAMLVQRDANRLAKSLAPLTGGSVANILFGVGVLGMTLSTITLLMLVSGFVICELFEAPITGWTFRLGSAIAGVGVLGPFIWSKAGFALAIPTSVFGFMLLPLAYLTFFLLMNQKSLLGSELPTGGRRVLWNVLMAVAAIVATVSSLYMVWVKVKYLGIIAIAALLGLALVVQIYRGKRKST